jgi:hypothetical protein
LARNHRLARTRWQENHQPIDLAALHRLELFDDDLVVPGEFESRPVRDPLDREVFGREREQFLHFDGRSLHFASARRARYTSAMRCAVAGSN